MLHPAFGPKIVIILLMKTKITKYAHWIICSCDTLVVALSYWLAFQLRFDFNLPEPGVHAFLNTLFIVVSIRLVSFYYFSLYRGIWRYASIDDLTSIFKAVAASQIAIVAVILFLKHAAFPR